MLDPVDVDIADSEFLTNQSDPDDSSDSDIDNYCLAFTCKNRLFGRQKPLHVVLGAGVCTVCHTDDSAALYDNLEDSVDSIAEKALIVIKKQYAVLDETVLQKLRKKVISNKNRKQPKLFACLTIFEVLLDSSSSYSRYSSYSVLAGFVPSGFF
ncbi:reticulon-like protein B4 [Pyrus ussuriensis x Pyrus communis]|uniref:Reticulon-like protein B4 n=1 Tax=Pyrus ussuriensis x Pyrus communis TaxID=2448454 RepID=A0A5N5H0Z1_9ROSA|nr:reticulon-like protein B4 [Pyrus ussuriensis x Pyrus communis]